VVLDPKILAGFFCIKRVDSGCGCVRHGQILAEWTRERRSQRQAQLERRGVGGLPPYPALAPILSLWSMSSD
jgi:hypothetical protein